MAFLSNIRRKGKEAVILFSIFPIANHVVIKKSIGNKSSKFSSKPKKLENSEKGKGAKVEGIMEFV